MNGKHFLGNCLNIIPHKHKIYKFFCQCGGVCITLSAVFKLKSGRCKVYDLLLWILGISSGHYRALLLEFHLGFLILPAFPSFQHSRWLNPFGNHSAYLAHCNREQNKNTVPSLLAPLIDGHSCHHLVFVPLSPRVLGCCSPSTRHGSSSSSSCMENHIITLL